MSARPPYFAMANTDPIDLIGAGLDLGHLGLHILAWAESSTHALDGKIAEHRLRRLPGWTQKRQDRLVESGAWQISDGVVELVGYLVTNSARADIEAKRAARQAAGASGGQASAASTVPLRDPETGRLIGRAPKPTEANGSVCLICREPTNEPGGAHYWCRKAKS